MKRIVFIITALSMFSIVSCNNEELDNIDNGVKEFVAYTDVQTKTTLAEDGLSTVWESEDEISINNVNYITYQDGPCSIFELYYKSDEPATKPFSAGYPYSYVGAHDDKTIIFSSHIVEEIDNILEVHNNIFMDGFFSMAYNEEEPVLKFKNIMSVLKFKVPEDYAEDIRTIEISVEEISDNNNALGGNVEVSYNNGEPKIVDLTDPQYICILKETEDIFEPGGIYYVPVIPGEKKGLTFKINGEKVGKINTIVCKRNVIHNLGTLPSGSN